MLPLRHCGSRGAVQMVVHDASVLCGRPSAGTRASSALALCRECCGCSSGRCSCSAKTTSAPRIPPPSAGQPVTSTSPDRSHWLSLALSNWRSSRTLTVALTLSGSGWLWRSLALNKLLGGATCCNLAAHRSVPRPAYYLLHAPAYYLFTAQACLLPVA